LASSKTNHSLISCFDLDDTLILGNSSFRFYLYLCKQKVFPYASLPRALWYFLRFRFLSLPLRKLHEGIFYHILHGRSLAILERYVSSFIQKEIVRSLYKPAIEKLDEARKRGDLTVVISSSPSFIVGKIAEFLQIDRWFASQYKVGKDGHFIAIDEIILGEDKKRIVLNLLRELDLSLKQVIAYSDSILDLPLLECAGKAVGVRPDKKLKALCLERGWPIL